VASIKQRIVVAALTLPLSTFLVMTGHETFVGTATKPTPYDVPTYGYGSTKGVKLGDKITPERALKRFATELDTEYVAAVKKYVKVPLYDYEFGAYVSFTYNEGVGAFRDSTLLKKLNSGDYAGACAELTNWNKQWTGKYDKNGKKIMVVLGGLTKRRAEERDICEGKYE
jgi:lysozyme